MWSALVNHFFPKIVDQLLAKSTSDKQSDGAKNVDSPDIDTKKQALVDLYRLKSIGIDPKPSGLESDVVAPEPWGLFDLGALQMALKVMSDEERKVLVDMRITKAWLSGKDKALYISDVHTLRISEAAFKEPSNWGDEGYHAGQDSHNFGTSLILHEMGHAISLSATSLAQRNFNVGKYLKNGLVVRYTRELWQLPFEPNSWFTAQEAAVTKQIRVLKKDKDIRAALTSAKLPFTLGSKALENVVYLGEELSSAHTNMEQLQVDYDKTRFMGGCQSENIFVSPVIWK
jgi:hypothetical protein